MSTGVWPPPLDCVVVCDSKPQRIQQVPSPSFSAPTGVCCIPGDIYKVPWSLNCAPTVHISTRLGPAPTVTSHVLLPHTPCSGYTFPTSPAPSSATQCTARAFVVHSLVNSVALPPPRPVHATPQTILRKGSRSHKAAHKPSFFRCTPSSLTSHTPPPLAPMYI